MVPLKRASSCSRHFAQSRRQLGEQSAHFSALLEHFFPPICPRLPNFVPPESYTLVFSAYIGILSPYSLLLTKLCLESVLLTLNMSYDATSFLCPLYPLKVLGQDASHENGYFLRDTLNKCFLTPNLPHTFSVTMATSRVSGGFWGGPDGPWPPPPPPRKKRGRGGGGGERGKKKKKKKKRRKRKSNF